MPEVVKIPGKVSSNESIEFVNRQIFRRVDHSVIESAKRSKRRPWLKNALDLKGIVSVIEKKSAEIVGFHF